MEPVRILYVNGGIMSRGGIESFMMNYYRNFDRGRIQIDFVVHGFEKGHYDDEILQLGGKIFNVPVKSVDFFGNIRALKKIFSSGNYKIVHSHMDAMSTVVLMLAKRCGIPVRIAHSHNTQHLSNNNIAYCMNEVARLFIKKYATHFFACSKDAASWLFGSGYVNRGMVKVIKNAIDVEAYAFNAQKRNEYRKKYLIGKNYVIGHVGRFDYQKNHLFLLKVFSEVCRKNCNITLVLIGDGKLKEEIVRNINELGIYDNVIMTGASSDVAGILSALDLLVFPSLFEGLGISLVEAQASGLKCLVSEKVPRESNLGNIAYLPIDDKSIPLWVNRILEHSVLATPRDILIGNFNEQGYNIKIEADRLQEFYLALQSKVVG